jgi:hypothetical protein
MYFDHIHPPLPSLIHLKVRNRSAVLHLELYPKECKSGYNKGTCTPMFIAALFTIAKLWKQPRCPTIDEWIKKMWYLFIYNGILFSHKEE